MYVTVVGSRKTPPLMCDLLAYITEQIARAGYTVRSGAADGSDDAGERGADRAGGKKEIYLPWKGYNSHNSPLYGVCEQALLLAASIHPVWDMLDQGPRKLQARNMYQVLGKTLDIPSDFLICWTEDGCESEKERKRKTGGTASAIVLADRRGIPVFNLGKKGSLLRLKRFLETKGIFLKVPDEFEVSSQADLF